MLKILHEEVNMQVFFKSVSERFSVPLVLCSTFFGFFSPLVPLVSRTCGFSAFAVQLETGTLIFY